MKAQISVSLTWVFAIIAGFLVFGLLVSFASDLGEQSNFESSITILNSLDTKITSIARTPSTFTKVQTANIRLQNLCEERETSGLLLEGASNIKPKPYQVIFSQDVLEGRQLLSWTQDWTLQTSVDRFLYLSTPDTVFVVIKDGGDEWEAFVEKIPPDFPIAVLDFDEIKSYNRRQYNTYIFLLFGPQDPSQPFISIPRDEIPVAPSADEIKAVRLIDHGTYGEAQFIELEDAWSIKASSEYIGDAMMFGAIFSENQEHFECNKKKAYFRMEQLARLNLERIQEIMRGLSEGQPQCQSPLGNYPPECNECLQVLSDAVPEYQKMITAASGIGNAEQRINEAALELESIEQDLKKGRNCPTL